MRIPARYTDRLEKLKRLPAGRRFETFYEWEHRQNRRRSSFRVPLMWMAAVVSAAVGVVLAFVPGPAVLFFALAGAIAATQSRLAARALDWTELKGRAAAHAALLWWRHSSQLEKVAAIGGLAILVLGIGAAAIAIVIGS
jgi:hypothetical protein